MVCEVVVVRTLTRMRYLSRPQRRGHAWLCYIETLCLKLLIYLSTSTRIAIKYVKKRVPKTHRRDTLMPMPLK